jgi:predicted MFS family arabinose efflux permease
MPSSPLGALWRPLALSTTAQLPLAALGIGLLVDMQHVTGSYAAAGLASGAYAAAAGAAAPALGRIADRRGKRRTLIGSAALCSWSLSLIALAPPSVPVVVLVLLAAAGGASVPPIAACTRSLLPHVVDAAAARSAFALESTALELTFIAGPPLALAIGSVWSPRVALASCAIVLLAATLAFSLATPLAAAAAPPRARTSSAATCPAIRTLVAALGCMGTLFGAVEVAITASAAGRAGPAGAAPLLALWGTGSLLGGAVSARAGGGAGSARGLALLLAALALSHAALAAATNRPLVSGAILVVAGATIAPTYATVYAMAAAAAPTTAATEAFAWLGTAIAAGTAAGAAFAGVLVEHAGPRPVLLLAGAAGCAAATIAVSRAPTLTPTATRSPI